MAAAYSHNTCSRCLVPWANTWEQALSVQLMHGLPCRVCGHRQRAGRQGRLLCWMPQPGRVRHSAQGPRSRPGGHHQAHGRHQAQDPGPVWEGRGRQEHLRSPAGLRSRAPRQRCAPPLPAPRHEADLATADVVLKHTSMGMLGQFANPSTAPCRQCMSSHACPCSGSCFVTSSAFYGAF